MVEPDSGGGGNRTRVTITSNLQGVPCAEDGLWCSHPTRSHHGNCARSATVRFGSIALCWQHADEFRAEARHAEYEAEVERTETRERRREAPGIIYFIQSHLGGPVKIGYTGDIATLARRRAELQIGNPQHLKVIATMDGTRETERELHQRFADARLGGEWFDLSDDLIALVYSLGEGWACGGQRCARNVPGMLTPWLDDGDVALYHGDALEVLAALPAGCAQTCVTSPPYWGLRSYLDDGHADKGAELGLEATPDAYVAALVSVMREVWRVLRDDGTLWLNLGASFYGGGAARLGALPDDTASTALPDLSDPDSAYRDLCDGCAVALLNHTAGSNQPPRGFSSQPSQIGRDSASQGFVGASPDVSLLDVPASTSPRSSQPLPGACSHCSNCDACLSVLRSSSRDARLCARTASSTNGSEHPAPADHNQGTDASGSAWLKYISSGLKPKDLVPIPWLVALALQADGWYLRSDIVWSKSNPMPESVTDRPTKAHEYVFLLAKQPRYFYDADAIREPHVGPLHAPGNTTAENWREVRGASVGKGMSGHLAEPDRTWGSPLGRNARSVWELATQPTPEAHFATYPEALVRRCILAGSKPGDTVLDPFVGSGTTALVARKHGRRAIGIDLSEEYLAIAARRTAQQSLLGGAA